MSKSLHARLVAYRPFGARIGVLAEPVSFSASMLHNDDGAISIEYSMLSGDAQAFDRELTDGLEVAVEVSDGTGYMEPDNMRYVITGRSGKTDDRTRTVTYSGQSISWLLSKAENNDASHLLADGDNKGKRPFYSSNPGVILKTLLDENRQRGGVATGLTLGFDTAKDAGGAAWAKKYTLYYSLGTDLQTILGSLVNGGGCDWRTSGRTLKMWNADSTALSRDLSKTVVLQLARDIGEAPYEESISDLASTILVEGDNSLLFRMDNPAAPTPWGKWESYSSQGGVSDKDTAQAFMQSTLADAARVRGQYTRDLVVAGVDALPLVDYHAGDWITAPTVSHGEKVRVQEIDLSMRQGEALSASLALNDIKYDASVRQAKKIKGITGGAALAGSESGTTASTDHDHRVPKAPQGLIVQTDAYVGSDGYARGLATVSWSAVTQATDNTSIEIASYRVEWRRHKDGMPWHAAGTTDKTQLGFGGLDCGSQIEVRVRAVPTYSDKLGEWSVIVVTTVESDVTPCSVPSRPVLSSELGVVTIHWDGKTSAGASMENDFDHIEVGEGANAAGMTVVSATQTGQGDYVVTGLTAGSEHSYALRSVDHAGNASAWSEIATVTVASAVSPAEVKKIQDDLAANDAALKDNSDKLAQAQKDIDKAQKDILDNAAKTSTAQDTADSAGAAASAAQGAADDAKTTASAAQSVADAAKTAAASATTTAGQAKTMADAAKKAAASAQGTAANAETLATTANQAASSAKSDAASAKTTAANASSVATQAKATADQAAQAATDAAGTAQKANSAAAAAAGIANGKADVLIQSTEPDTSMRKSTTLWIDTTNGANTPKKWGGSAWVAVTDKAATDAANAAVKANDAAQKAQTTADNAATAAANAAAQANQANAAAQKAQTTADGKNLIYRGPTEPEHSGLRPGDLWWKQPADSTHVTQILTWDGTKFTQFDLAANDIVAVGTISANHLSSKSVTTDKIVSGAVNVDKLATNSVNALKIVSGAVTTDKLATNSVTAVKIAAGTITSDKVHRRDIPELRGGEHRHEVGLDRIADVGFEPQPDRVSGRRRQEQRFDGHVPNPRERPPRPHQPGLPVLDHRRHGDVHRRRTGVPRLQRLRRLPRASGDHVRRPVQQRRCDERDGPAERPRHEERSRGTDSSQLEAAFEGRHGQRHHVAGAAQSRHELGRERRQQEKQRVPEFAGRRRLRRVSVPQCAQRYRVALRDRHQFVRHEGQGVLHRVECERRDRRALGHQHRIRVSRRLPRRHHEPRHIPMHQLAHHQGCVAISRSHDYEDDVVVDACEIRTLLRRLQRGHGIQFDFHACMQHRQGRSAPSHRIQHGQRDVQRRLVCRCFRMAGQIKEGTWRRFSRTEISSSGRRRKESGGSCAAWTRSPHGVPCSARRVSRRRARP